MQLATRENVYRTRNHRCASILKTAYSSLVLVALMALEFIVAFLQAFVFAALTCTYLSDVVNLDHGH